MAIYIYIRYQVAYRDIESCVRDLICLQVNNRRYETVFNEYATYGLPICGTLIEQLADRFQCQFYYSGRICHRTHLGQMFLFNRANG